MVSNLAPGCPWSLYCCLKAILSHSVNRKETDDGNWEPKFGKAHPYRVLILYAINNVHVTCHTNIPNKRILASSWSDIWIHVIRIQDHVFAYEYGSGIPRRIWDTVICTVLWVCKRGNCDSTWNLWFMTVSKWIFQNAPACGSWFDKGNMFLLKRPWPM